MKSISARMFACCATAASLAALAAGCGILAVGPDYSEPAVDIEEYPLPDAGYPTTNKTETGEFAPAATNEDPRVEIKREDIFAWWEQFGDETLTSLVKGAVTNNLSYLMACERLEQARWRLLGSAADAFPHIGLAGSASENEYGKATPTGSAAGRKIHRDFFRGGFDATWEIDIFGGVRRGMERAYASLQEADLTLTDTWVSLTAEIGSAYISLRTVQQRLRVARANLKIQSETYDILKSRLDSGIGDELAVKQAKYNVEQTRAGIPALLSTEEELMNTLAILAGDVPGSLHDTLRELPDRDWLLEPRRLGEIPLDLMRERPDVRAAERALAAQVASVGVAKSLLYPKFYINGSLGLESYKWDDLLHRRALTGSIGPSFSWPIFQGGNLVANVREEESKMEEALLRYELALQTAYAEARSAYAAYTQQYHRYQSLEGAVKAAQDAEAISQDLYKNGLADFNNVLDAQRSLLTLEESLVVSRGQISIDIISLFKALGGGYAVDRSKGLGPMRPVPQR